MKTVSVIIPAFNTAKYVGFALQGLRNQTFQAWKCVVVNDGSVDGTADIANLHARQDPRIQVLNQENRGYTKACNAGFKMIADHGDYVLFTDSDDVMQPMMLERMVAYLDAHPEAGAVYCDYEVINAEGQIVPPWPKTRYELAHGIWPRLVPWPKALMPFECLYAWGPVSETYTMMRRELYEACGRWPETYVHGMSIILFGQIALRSQVHFMPEKMFHYRWHGNNWSAQHNQKKAEIEIKIRQFYQQLSVSQPNIKPQVSRGERLLRGFLLKPRVTVFFGALKRGRLLSAAKTLRAAVREQLDFNKPLQSGTR